MTSSCILSSRSEIYRKLKGGFAWLGKVPVLLLVVHFIIVCCGTGMNISEVDTVFPSFVFVNSVGLRLSGICILHKPLAVGLNHNR